MLPPVKPQNPPWHTVRVFREWNTGVSVAACELGQTPMRRSPAGVCPMLADPRRRSDPMLGFDSYRHENRPANH
jgi:hypothetical protein